MKTIVVLYENIQKSKRQLLLALLLIFSSFSYSHSHPGGKDHQGGHHQRSNSTYHFHEGPLKGETFGSKDAATAALEGGQVDSPAGANRTLGEIHLENLDMYLPAIDENDQIVVHTGFTLSYSEPHEQAEWVAYLVTAERLKGDVKRTNNFRIDPAISTGSSVLGDYKGSGYDRGHLAPAASMAWSKQAMSESFFLSNMSPQKPGFNRGIWKKLEAKVRDFAREHETVVIITGPVLEKGLLEIGPSGLDIPRAYYKVVLDVTEPTLEGIAFVLPNESSKKPLRSFAVTIDYIEEITGINFFAALEDGLEERIEGNYSVKHWGI